MEYEKKIKSNASKCGLSVSEYVRQRALGLEPKTVPPDAFFYFCEKFDALMDKPFSENVNDEAKKPMAEISKQLLEPAKEGDVVWQPPYSGLSKEN